MKRILVGIDGSPGARAAVAWASRLAVTVGADLILVHVLPGGPAPDAASDPPEMAAGVRWRRLIRRGAGGEGLIRAAEAEDADLVVVGSTGVRWFPAPHPAHTGHYVVCHSTRPVAVVPPGIGDVPVGRLVVGVDESPGGFSAVRWAAEAPAAFTHELVALHAASAPLPLAAAVPPDRPWEQSAMPASWTEAFRIAEIAFTIRSVEEDPVVALCEVADEVRYSTIVVGGRAVDDHRPLRIGSVGLRVLDRSRRPVIVIPTRPSDAARRPTWGATARPPSVSPR